MHHFPSGINYLQLYVRVVKSKNRIVDEQENLNELYISIRMYSQLNREEYYKDCVEKIAYIFLVQLWLIFHDLTSRSQSIWRRFFTNNVSGTAQYKFTLTFIHTNPYNLLFL